MRIEAAHELIAVVSYHSIARDLQNCAPRFGQKDRRITDQKDDTHDCEEFQEPFFANAPTSSGNSLKCVVVGDANGDHLWKIL